MTRSIKNLERTTQIRDLEDRLAILVRQFRTASPRDEDAVAAQIRKYTGRYKALTGKRYVFPQLLEAEQIRVATESFVYDESMGVHENYRRVRK